MRTVTELKWLAIRSLEKHIGRPTLKRLGTEMEAAASLGDKNIHFFVNSDEKAQFIAKYLQIKKYHASVESRGDIFYVSVSWYW